MIKLIFKNLTKNLNSILRFIKIKILNRKKGFTIVDFIYLILNEFSKTIFYKALLIIYKIVGFIIALLSLGILYNDNFKYIGISDILGKLKNVIIGIYDILYNSIKLIYKLIFKSKNEDSIPEPYDFYTEPKNYIYNEANSWYHDYYLVGGCLILLLSLLGYSYLKWDNDSTIKDNFIEILSSLILTTKAIKDNLLNKINNQRRDNSSENNLTDIDNESNLSYVNENIYPENVDLQILNNKYKYQLFKNLHEKETMYWPEYESNDYDKMIRVIMENESNKIKYTNENIENLIERYLETEVIIKNSTNEELINMHQIFQKTNKEIKEFNNTSNEAWVKKFSDDQSYPNDNSTPKASTSNINNDVLTEIQQAKLLAKSKGNIPEKDFVHENNSFLENFKGKLKTGFESTKNITSEILEVSDDNNSNELIHETKIENIIPQKPKSLFESISLFNQNDLSKTVTVIQKEYNSDGSIKRILTDTDIDIDTNGNMDLKSMTKKQKEILNHTLKTYELEVTDDGFKSTKFNNSNNKSLIEEQLAKMRKHLNDSPEKEDKKWDETPSVSITNESEDISKAKV